MGCRGRTRHGSCGWRGPCYGSGRGLRAFSRAHRDDLTLSIGFAAIAFGATEKFAADAFIRLRHRR
jgi:hypothetical protein